MLLDGNSFFIRERTGLTLTDTYDIFDPVTKSQVGLVKEETLPVLKYLRILLSKQLLPTKLLVYDCETNNLQFSLEKDLNFGWVNVYVYDSHHNAIGYLSSLGSGFYEFKVYNMQKEQIGEVNGDWWGWGIQYIDMNDTLIGQISKKSAGMTWEMFTTADNYLVALEPGMENDLNNKIMLLAAGLAFDIVYKAKNDWWYDNSAHWITSSRSKVVRRKKPVVPR